MTEPKIHISYRVKIRDGHEIVSNNAFTDRDQALKYAKMADRRLDVRVVKNITMDPIHTEIYHKAPDHD